MDSLLSLEAEQQGFLLNGEISNLPDHSKVELLSIDFGSIAMSSFSNAGKFTMSGKVDEATLCMLRIGRQYTQLIIENTAITAQCSAVEQLGFNCKILGGREQDILNELRKAQFPYDQKWMTAFHRLQTSQFKDESKKRALQKQIGKHQRASHQVFIDFGIKNPNSCVGVDILYRNRKAINRDQLKALYEQLHPVYKKTFNGKALHFFLTAKIAKTGDQFIDFTAKKADGKSFTLSSLIGNNILLNFWGVGCSGARQRNKYLSKNFDRIPKNLDIVNFSTIKNTETWKQASAKDGIRGLNITADTNVAEKIKIAYGVQGVPFYVLINTKGIIIAKEREAPFDPDLIEFISKTINKKY